MELSNHDEQETFDTFLLHQLADNCYPPGKLECVIKARVEAGRSIDLKNTHGETPFIAALRVGNTHAAQLFLNAGCDYRSKDRENCPALNLAAQGGDVQTVTTLLDKNIPLDQVDSKGNTPLHAVIYRGKWLNQSYSALELQTYQALCAERILSCARKQGIDPIELINKKNFFEKTAVDDAELGNMSVLCAFIAACPQVTIGMSPVIVQCLGAEHMRCMRLLRCEILRNKQHSHRVEEVFQQLDVEFKKLTHGH